jgi:endonuclease-3
MKEDRQRREEKQRARKIVTLLKNAYPDARCSLNYSNPLELLVATILSAQCTDERVNIVTADLFRKYRTAEDYSKAPQGELEQEIRSTGFFRNKAKAIQGACRLILERHGGRVPDSIDELIALPGVARKTANVVLGNAFGVPAIAVDTHVLRLANRLALAKSEDPEQVHDQLAAVLPQARWTHACHLIQAHGRRTCTARKPLCPACPVRALCPWPLKTR